MSFFKRVTVAVSTQLDRLVGEIENHDAVVEAGIRESRHRFAKAKVRHARLCQDGERLRRTLEGLRADAAAWRERARRCDQRGDGEEQALLCLSRAKRAAAQAASLEETYQRHVEVQTRLGQEIDALRHQVESLEHRRQLLRSREATADAAARIRETEGGGVIDLEGTLERWEIRVTESELTTDALAERDPFEAAFVVEEERAALRAELDAMKRDRQGRSGEAA